MFRSREEGARSAYWTVLPGLIAGAVEVVVTQPFDLLATRYQLSTASNPSVYHGLRGIYREGGVGRFYRGMMPELLSTMPARMAMYTGFAATVVPLKELARSHGGEPVTGLCSFAAGLVSGVAEGVVATPLQLVKVRLQSKSYLGMYKSGLHCLSMIIRKEGVLTLWQGLGSVILRNSCFNSVYFTAQERLRPLGGALDGPMNPLRAALCALAAAFLGTSANAPFDVAKSRIQAQVRGEGRYRSTLQTLALVAREEGVAAIYRGWQPKVIRHCLGAFFAIPTLEVSQHLAEKLADRFA